MGTNGADAINSIAKLVPVITGSNRRLTLLIMLLWRTWKKFDPSVTEDNHVITINKDLKSEHYVLPYAAHR